MTYNAKRIGLDTWKRLSDNCPKLTHIYQTPKSCMLFQMDRQIVAKRVSASGLITKMQPKSIRIHGGLFGNLVRDVYDYDSSDGDEDKSVVPVTYSYSSSSDSSMDDFERWAEEGAWWKRDSD
jgi:hypothetical protein